MLGVFMCYIMLQMALLEGMRKEEQEEVIKGEEGKPNKGIKSLWKKSA